tara:strand:- start:295 stop:525 length:231 start_codon:yes stop_codon:yes gene_type:complete
MNLLNTFAAASLDLNEAWNLSWSEGIQFILVLAFVYWLKVKIDTRAGLGKKKLRQLKTVIKEAIIEANVDTVHTNQ